MATVFVGASSFQSDPSEVTYDRKVDNLLSRQQGRAAAILVEEQEPYRILSANDAWSQLCGFSKEEAIGQTTKLLQGELTQDDKASTFARKLHLEGAAKTVLVNYTKQGAPFVHSISAKRIEDAAGEGYYLVQGAKVEDKEMAGAVLRQSQAQAAIRSTRSQLTAVALAMVLGAALAFATQEKYMKASPAIAADTAALLGPVQPAFGALLAFLASAFLVAFLAPIKQSPTQLDQLLAIVLMTIFGVALVAVVPADGEGGGLLTALGLSDGSEPAANALSAEEQKIGTILLTAGMAVASLAVFQAPKLKRAQRG